MNAGRSAGRHFRDLSFDGRFDMLAPWPYSLVSHLLAKVMGQDMRKHRLGAITIFLLTAWIQAVSIPHSLRTGRSRRAGAEKEEGKEKPQQEKPDDSVRRQAERRLASLGAGK